MNYNLMHLQDVAIERMDKVILDKEYKAHPKNKLHGEHIMLSRLIVVVSTKINMAHNGKYLPKRAKEHYDRLHREQTNLIKCMPVVLEEYIARLKQHTPKSILS